MWCHSASFRVHQDLRHLLGVSGPLWWDRVLGSPQGEASRDHQAKTDQDLTMWRERSAQKQWGQLDVQVVSCPHLKATQLRLSPFISTIQSLPRSLQEPSESVFTKGPGWPSWDTLLLMEYLYPSRFSNTTLGWGLALFVSLPFLLVSASSILYLSYISHLLR